MAPRPFRIVCFNQDGVDRWNVLNQRHFVVKEIGIQGVAVLEQDLFNYWCASQQYVVSITACYIKLPPL
jgi:hypothetical protein